MEVENYLGIPMTDPEDLKIQTCVAQGDLGHQQPMDYSMYLNVVTGYMLCLCLLFMLGFRTEMHRTKADTTHGLNSAAGEPSKKAMNGGSAIAFSKDPEAGCSGGVSGESGSSREEASEEEKLALVGTSMTKQPTVQIS